SDIAESEVILLDPMLATGGSGVAAVNFLKEREVKKIKFVCIIASEEGVEVLHKAHPDVAIFCASVDPILNEDSYIVPGLGDAGDRLFGTK
ncbi:MAG TPA: uracil phosphoribosyltransferase, partial [Clostridia bacterium]|nr:uracil phosphoribosyltransferase [Clostridia bacterium]